MDKKDKKIQDVIKTVGWYVFKVFDEKGQLPDFAYSVGAFYSYQQPEIIIYGLDLDDMHNIINDIVGAMKDGKKIRVNKPYDDFLVNYDCLFRRVRKKHYREHFGYGRWFYQGNNFPALQCFWPDANGVYPWQEGCAQYVIDCQPLLFHP